MRLKVEGEPKSLEIFTDILMDQNKNFELYKSFWLSFQILEQKNTIFEINIFDGISIDEISSLKTADFRFKTSNRENELLVEFEKLLKDLYRHFIIQSDACKRFDKANSKQLKVIAKSLLSLPELWIKSLDYYLMEKNSLFDEEEIDDDIYEFISDLVKRNQIESNLIESLKNFKHNKQNLSDIKLLNNKDYNSINQLENYKFILSWRNLIEALDLSMKIYDENKKLLLEI